MRTRASTQTARSERRARRALVSFQLQWGEPLPSNLSGLNRRSRAHFWNTNNEYMMRCLQELLSIGGRPTSTVRPCFICTLSSSSTTLPCGHAMCSRCTVNIMTMSAYQGMPLRCPFCREDHHLSEEQQAELLQLSALYTANIARHYNFYEEAHFLIEGYYPN